MGGNALEAHTERASPREYLNAFTQVQTMLQEEWPNVVTYLPRKHRTKQDHGDLDLLVRRDTVDISRDWVNETFNPTDLIVNDGVWTFDLYDFQIDLMTKREEHWKMSKAFFDQSGLGKLYFYFILLSEGVQGIFAHTRIL